MPTGAPDAFVGDPAFAAWPIVAGEWRPVREVRLALNVGYRFIAGDGATLPADALVRPPTFGMMDVMGQPSGAATAATDYAAQGSPITYDDLLTLGFGASYRIFDAVDLVAETYAQQIVTEFGTEGAFSMEALGGLKIFVERNSHLVLAAGGGLPIGGVQQADFRGVVGFIFEPSIGDRDGDGIKDDYDQCPDEPEDYDGFQDEDGCPDPDNDQDGIPDKDDACPLVPEDRDGDQDEDGCPEGAEGDRDGDGVPDDVDACPDEPEDRDGFEDEDGCPDPDNDQDGILDADDLCPNQAEDRDGFEDEDGCPDRDNDADRIADTDDQCPDRPETYNGTEDEDGCPDQGSVVIEDNSIVILEKIYFETDSAQIQRRSFPILDAVAATLNGNPHITLIEIQGHADERGADDYNLRLTRDRAASVLQAMVSRGVDKRRVRSAGYGERCPVSPGHNAAAWEKNRRVEFRLSARRMGPRASKLCARLGGS